MYDAIENVNYARDARTQGPAKAPVLYDEGGAEIELPTTWGVCPVCNGEGTHVNPAIDCNGLTAEDFAEDPDFAEEYMRGTYDVTCNHCEGRTTVRVVDWDALTAEQRQAYEAQLRADAEYQAERLSEIRMGC